MPRQNRVTPRGDLIAVPDRGITPRATVAVIAAGYQPVLHSSAGAG
jgi:hypothetical protein